MTTSSPQSITRSYIHLLLRWRWLISGLAALITIFVELHEGHEFDAIDLIFELIVPIALWFLLTMLAHSMAQRVKSNDDLERHRQLARQLAEYSEWGDLIQWVIQFASTFLPVDHASLFIYDHRNARLQFVTQWNSPNRQINPSIHDLPFGICRTCLLDKPNGMRRTVMCSSVPGPSGAPGAADYCLPLSYGGLLVGILRLRCQPGREISTDHINFMNSVTSEIALALVALITRPQRMDEVRAEAQISERRRIAYDLHDSLAQQIGYLHLSLDRFANDDRLAQFGDIQAELEYSREAAGHAYERIRGIMSILRLGSWESVDLTQAIADYSRQVARHVNLVADLTTRGEPIPLPPSTCEQVFGLVREGLNNVEKHAHARHVQITLSWSADSLNIDLIDNGVGFDPSSIPDGHYGLAMMHERAVALGGELSIESVPGRGTRLSFSVPCALPPTSYREQATALVDRFVDQTQTNG